MKTYCLYFIRHGETRANAEQRYAGSTDFPITDGAVKHLEELRASGTYPEVDGVYASPMRRCVQTAGIIYPDMPVQTVDALREFDFGIFENKTAGELAENPEFLRFAAGKSDGAPGGEKLKDFTVRVCEGLRQVVYDMSDKDYSDAAVVVHGGVIMQLFAACALPRRPMVKWSTDNGHGYAVRVTPTLYARSGAIEVTASF